MVRGWDYHSAKVDKSKNGAGERKTNEKDKKRQDEQGNPRKLVSHFQGGGGGNTS